MKKRYIQPNAHITQVEMQQLVCLSFDIDGVVNGGVGARRRTVIDDEDDDEEALDIY